MCYLCQCQELMYVLPVMSRVDVCVICVSVKS